MQEKCAVPGIGSKKQAEAKLEMYQHLKNAPADNDLIIANLPLYLRSVMLAKTLYINELYQQILHLPGVIMEFGVWWGANMALFSSFRSVYEPYNWPRKVIGFDAFEGYKNPGEKDGGELPAITTGHAMQEGHVQYLEEVLRTHEKDNPMDHIKKFELVKGDVRETLGPYLERNPSTIISLAYIDLGLYEPCRFVLDTIRPHLIPGSVIALDELNSPHFPGETIALRETLGLNRYRIRRSAFLPDRAYVVID